MYETKINKFNRLRDEKRIKDICSYLDKITLNIINIEANFKYSGSKEDGYFNISNYNKGNNDLFMNLNFRLYYPTRNSYFFDKSARNLNDEEFDKYIEYKYNESELFCAQINWFSVNPKRQGYGTKIISELINILKIVESIEMILLHPVDNDSKLFWLSNNFDDNKIYDKRIKLLNCKDMIYKYY